MRTPFWLYSLCSRIIGLFGYWIVFVVETEDGEADGWITRTVIRRRWTIKRRHCLA